MAEVLYLFILAGIIEFQISLRQRVNVLWATYFTNRQKRPIGLADDVTGIRDLSVVGRNLGGGRGCAIAKSGSGVT